MPIKKREELYDLFSTGNKPTQDDFTDLIDSMINIAEDGIGASEKGKPMEIIEQGTARRLLDFSSAKDMPIWRIAAQSNTGNNGLNISLGNVSRIFFSQQTGNAGINNDNPAAKLHIIPDSGPAFRVDDAQKSDAFVVGNSGSIGMGQLPDNAYRLSVDGKVNLKSEVTVGGYVTASDGLMVDGQVLTAKHGVTVNNGASIEDGMVNAKGGLTVSGDFLTAQAGAVVNGLTLAANAGLSVDNGAVIETGMMTIKDGLTLTGKSLDAQAGATIGGSELIINSGMLVEGGEVTLNVPLTAHSGLSVNESTLRATGTVNLGKAETGSVTIHGTLTAQEDVIIDKSLLTAKMGITVQGAALNAEKGAVIKGAPLTIENGLSITGGDINIGVQANVTGGLSVNGSDLHATGNVFLGTASTGDVTVEGEMIAKNGITVNASVLTANNGLIVDGLQLEAKSGVHISGGKLNATSGAQISGDELIVENGMTVKNGAEIEIGELAAKGGVNLYNSSLQADGLVTLGNNLTGTVDIEGKLAVNNEIKITKNVLRAEKGVTVTGEELLAKAGATVGGRFTASDTVVLGDTTIRDLTLLGSLTADNLSFNSLNLDNLTVSDAIIDNLETTGTIAVYDQFEAASDCVLGSCRILVTYEGPADDGPQADIISGTVTTGQGHVDFDVVDKKLMIIYDSHSDINTIVKDWRAYKQNNPDKTKGYNLDLSGASSWRMENTTIEMSSAGNFYKEYRISINGVRVTYTGTDPGTPGVMVISNDDVLADKFTFSITDLMLRIIYPQSDELRTVSSLLEDWEEWKKENDTTARDFELTQTEDTGWVISDLDTPVELTVTDQVVREYQIGELKVIHSGDATLESLPDLVIKEAVPNSPDQVSIITSFDIIEISLGNVENTPAAIYNAWEQFKLSGSTTYDFDIKKTTNTTPLTIIQEESPLSVVDNQSHIRFPGFMISYTGDNPGDARVQLHKGGELFTFEFNAATLSIYYPENPDNRTLTNIETEWNKLQGATHGFDLVVNDSTAELQVKLTTTIETVVAEIKELTPQTVGADSITIRYAGPGVDTPSLIILENTGSTAFNVPIVDNVMTIKYPEGKSKNVDEFLNYWDGLSDADRGNFSITRNDIADNLLEDVQGVLQENADNYTYSKGIKKISTVTIDGNLKFRGSDIEINDISGNGDLEQNSDTVLATQKAIKAYADTKALKAGEASQDFNAQNLTLAGTLGFASGVSVDSVSDDGTLAADSNTTIPTQKAVKAYADTKALKAGEASQDFNAQNLTLAGTLGFASGVSVDSVSDDGTLAADSNTAVPTQKAVKAYADTKALKAGEASQDFNAQNLTLAGTLGFASGVSVDSVSDDGTLAADSNTTIPTQKAVKAYADTKVNKDELAKKADKTALATKTDRQAENTLPVAKETAVNFTTITVSPTSMGMLILRVTTSSGVLNGLVAIYGTDGAVKISGDAEITDQKDSTSTFNIYFDNGSLFVQNNLDNDVTLNAVYTGV